MKRIVFITTSGRSTINADEAMTLSELFDSNNIVYSGRTVTLNGMCVYGDMYDQTLEDLIDGDTATIGVSAKSENAAGAIVAGNALIVTSALKLDELKTIAKYRPKALHLIEKDEDGNKEEVFSIYLKEGAGKLQSFCATYGSNVDEEGHARLTMLVDPADKDTIMDQFGPALLNLTRLESTLGAAIEDIAAEKRNVEDHIIFA